AIALRTALGKRNVRSWRSHRSQREAHGVGAVLLDDVDWVHHVALGFRHLLALGIADQRVYVHSAEGYFAMLIGAHEVAVHHDHSRHPKEQDVKAGDEQRCWIERVE